MVLGVELSDHILSVPIRTKKVSKVTNGQSHVTCQLADTNPVNKQRPIQANKQGSTEGPHHANKQGPNEDPNQTNKQKHNEGFKEGKLTFLSHLSIRPHLGPTTRWH
jgi:hypothetical protein